jgi:tetratricopeptide (TPR) repeat protein
MGAAMGAPVVVFVALGLVALMTLSALAGWLYLRWPAEKPLVFVTKFAATTSAGSEAAANHVRALSERLESTALIEQQFELRSLPEPLSKPQADLLLVETGAVAVIFGDVRAIEGIARWKLQMLMQWPAGDGSVTNVRIIGPEELKMETFTRSRAPAPRHEQFVDGGDPLRRLADETFESDHADRAVGTLLVFAADLARSRDAGVVEACLEGAVPLKMKLSPRTLTALEVMRCTSQSSDPSTIVSQLEVAGEAGADHPDLWNALLSFALLLKASGELESKQFLEYAQRGVRSDPSDSQSRYNLAEAYMANGEVDKGLAEFEALTEDEEYRQRPYLFMGIGVIHYNHTRDFSQARDAYERAAELKPSPQAFLYLADAQRSLGEDDSARENYQKALMLDPTLVDAHRGYTGVAGGAGVAPPLFNRVVSAMAEARTSPLPLNRILRPLLWRLLLWHYKRHPEDSRLHYMLGYCALLREEFDFAIERLIYAFKLFEGADLEALAVAATAMGLKGDTDACRDALKTLRTSPIRPGMAALTGADDSIAQRLSTVFSPFNWEPRLLELQTTGSLEQALNGVFPDYAPRQ